MVIAIDQRRPPICAVELQLESAVDRADPEAILVDVCVPLPVDRLRALAALVAQSHEVRLRARRDIDFEADILDLDRCRRNNPAPAIGESVVFQQTGHLQGDPLCLRERDPVHRTLEFAGESDLR